MFFEFPFLPNNLWHLTSPHTPHLTLTHLETGGEKNIRGGGREERTGREMAEPAPLASSIRAEAIDAAKAGDQHRLRSYLDEEGGDVNLRDPDTQGTLLHVRCTLFGMQCLNYKYQR